MFKSSTPLFLAVGIALAAGAASAHVNPTAPLFQPALSFDRPAAVPAPASVLSSQVIGN